jgi:hypothetical protein
MYINKMKKLLLIALAIPISVGLHAQDEALYNGDTTGKVQMTVDSRFELSNMDSFMMHNLRSQEDYGVLLRGRVNKPARNESIYFCNYEKADMIIFMKNESTYKKEEYFDGVVVTTEFLD